MPRSKGWGLFHWLSLPGLIEILLAIILFDHAIWVQLLVTQNVPLLSRTHIVRHTHHDLDAISVQRFQTVEILLSALYKLAVILILGPAVIAVVAFEMLLIAGAMLNQPSPRVEQERNLCFSLSISERMFSTYKVTPAKK